MRLGIAAIGKGYGIDRAAEVLEARGIEDYIVEGGGDVRLRVREGGEVTHRLSVEREAFACMLGGPDGRTLFVCTAGHADPERTAVRDGRIECARVEVPRAGWP